ncbi:hypothetical protein ACI1MP_37005 [Kitasatospora griseola]|uniref:hypothetical protein n=1 Tax=Kitasatospora griseola TaxID=2064 RepID=UPI0038560009
MQETSTRAGSASGPTPPATSTATPDWRRPPDPGPTARRSASTSSAARIAAHRRLRQTFLLAGRAPFAVNVDSYLYTTDQPTPLELLPIKDDGTPVPGALRLGIAPGSHRHEASIPLQTAVEAMERREHPSRLTRSYAIDGTEKTDTVNDGQEGGR